MQCNAMERNGMEWNGMYNDVCMRWCMYACMHVCIYACLFVCLSVRIYPCVFFNLFWNVTFLQGMIQGRLLHVWMFWFVTYVSLWFWFKRGVRGMNFIGSVAEVVDVKYHQICFIDHVCFLGWCNSYGTGFWVKETNRNGVCNLCIASPLSHNMVWVIVHSFMRINLLQFPCQCSAGGTQFF